METGNPKQVAVLAIAAVGAVGFLVMRMGHHDAAPAAASAAKGHATGKDGGPGGLVVVKDPFSHPRLAPAKEPKDMSKPPTDAPDGMPLKGLPATSVGGPVVPVGPVVPAGLTGHLPDASPTPGGKGDATPADATKASAPAPTSIALEAIAGSGETMAFLSVGGAESQPYRPHDRISGSIRLLRVEDGAVVLSGPKGELTLAVGERKEL